MSESRRSLDWETDRLLRMWVSQHSITDHFNATVLDDIMDAIEVAPVGPGQVCVLCMLLFALLWFPLFIFFPGPLFKLARQL
jgi:hypothetical protein